jgi:threonine/homoserine/homoserine lactone efflux protein
VVAATIAAMGEAIAFAITFALGVALNPIPVLAIVLILAAPRGLVRGAALFAGALAGLAVVATVVLLLESGADPVDDGETAAWVSLVQLIVAVLLLLLAARKWRARHRGDGDAPELPGWVSALENLTPGRAAAAGFVLMGVNPKNIMIAAGAVTSIVGAGTGTGGQVVAVAVFVLVGVAGLGLPVLATAVFGARASRALGALRDWMLRHHRVITAGIVVVIALVLLVDSVTALAG